MNNERNERNDRNGRKQDGINRGNRHGGMDSGNGRKQEGQNIDSKQERESKRKERKERKEDAVRKRRRAIALFRQCGMSDAEIEAELGMTLKQVDMEDNIIDVEVVSIEDKTDDNNLWSKSPMGNSDGEMRERFGSSSVLALKSVESNSSASQSNSGAETLSGTKKVHKWSEEFWAQAKPEVQARRCKAHRKNGFRCLKAAIKGGRVCATHGGSAPHVKAAARARLDNAADRMARNLLRLADDAESEQVQLKATDSALDRVGIRPPNEVFISPGQPKPWEEVYEGMGTMTREESRAARGLGLEIDQAPIDAEANSSDSQHNSPNQTTASYRPDDEVVNYPQGSEDARQEPGNEGVHCSGNHDVSSFTTPAPAFDATTLDVDCDRLSDTHTDEREVRMRSHQTEPVDGSQSGSAARIGDI